MEIGASSALANQSNLETGYGYIVSHNYRAPQCNQYGGLVDQHENVKKSYREIQGVYASFDDANRACYSVFKKRMESAMSIKGCMKSIYRESMKGYEESRIEYMNGAKETYIVERSGLPPQAYEAQAKRSVATDTLPQGHGMAMKN